MMSVMGFNSGEFEVYISIDRAACAFGNGDVFITRPDSDIAMYVETVKLNTDQETGDYLTVSGQVGRGASVVESRSVRVIRGVDGRKHNQISFH